jgi:hypothetical protein
MSNVCHTREMYTKHTFGICDGCEKATLSEWKPVLLILVTRAQRRKGRIRILSFFSYDQTRFSPAFETAKHELINATSRLALKGWKSVAACYRSWYHILCNSTASVHDTFSTLCTKFDSNQLNLSYYPAFLFYTIVLFA